MRKAFPLRLDERGNSLIEFALVLPIMSALLIGAVDISGAYSSKLRLEQIAQRMIEKVQASEYATTDNSDIEAEAEAAAGSGSNATVTSWLECNHNGTHLDYDTGTCANSSDPYARYVRVTLSQPFTPMFGTALFPDHNSNGTVPVEVIAGVRMQ